VLLSAVASHPDNVRRHVGDLTELVRSIKAHGVLQPLWASPRIEEGLG
jgi:ParB-like chromosome segregation protein Spo0J